MSDLEKSLIHDMVQFIMENADEVLAEKDKTDYSKGQLLAYTSVLDIIKDTLSGYDLKEFGLDYDVEEKYLGIKSNKI